MSSGTIVCAVDATPEAEIAAGAAVRLAARLDLRLVLAHVVEALEPEEAADGHGAAARRAAAEARRLLAHVAAAAGAGEADVRVEFGDRAERLAEIAAEEAAELVVLGERRQRLLSRVGYALASVLAASAACPVVVVPAVAPVRQY
jgi:nucleotide-binding universal stress UspA family protein